MADLPEAIFKYVGPARIDIIQKLRVRFTQPSRCNDPFEAQLCIEGLEDQALLEEQIEKIDRQKWRRYVLRQQSLGKASPSFQDFRRTFFGSSHERGIRLIKQDVPGARERAAQRVRCFWDTLGLLSLTATENHLLMWAHYTEGHKGMVIEFDPRHPFFNPPDNRCDQRVSRADIQFGALTPVRYSPKRPSHRIGETPDPADFFIKSQDWSYENEWRVIQLLELADELVRTDQGIVHLFKLPPESVRRVVMGNCMDETTRNNLMTFIRQNPALRHVRLEEAKLDLDAFRLNYVPSASTRG